MSSVKETLVELVEAACEVQELFGYLKHNCEQHAALDRLRKAVVPLVPDFLTDDWDLCGVCGVPMTPNTGKYDVEVGTICPICAGVKKDALSSYGKTDHLSMFLDKCCSRDPNGAEKISELDAAYRDWIKNNYPEVPNISLNVFSKNIVTELGFGSRVVGPYRYQTGLLLREEYRVREQSA